MSRAPDRLCQGLDLRICATCHRNADNHPGVVIDRFLHPHANPPRCADWQPMPERALDASHSRL